MHTTGLISFDWSLIMHMVTLVVLYFILKKYFFEKVRAFMQAREQKVKDSFDNADATNKQADERLKEYNRRLEDIDIERREILKEARQEAEKRANTIIDEASEKAHGMILQTEKEIEQEKANALNEMKTQVGLLAIYAAEQIIKQKLDGKEQQAIIDGVIREAGKAEWKR